MSFALPHKAACTLALVLALPFHAGQACDMPVPPVPSLSAALKNPRATVFVGTVVRTLPGTARRPGASVMRVDEWFAGGAGQMEVTVRHDPPTPDSPCGPAPYFSAHLGEQWLIVVKQAGKVREADVTRSLRISGDEKAYQYGRELEAFLLSRKTRQ